MSKASTTFATQSPTSSREVDLAFYRETVTRLSDGRLAPAELNNKQRSRLVREARRQEEIARGKVVRHVQLGNVCAAKRAQRAYLRSRAARIVAAYRYCRGAPAERFARAWEVSSRLGFAATPGECRVRKKRKADGRSSRPLGSFRTVDKAQQRLLANAITPFFGHRRDQYGQRGKDLAVEALRNGAESAEPTTVFVHVDVCQFYENVSHDWVRENVPLPPALISWALTSGYSITSMASRRQAPCYTQEEIRRMALCGLPQGSVLSPFVAEFVIESILAEAGLPRHFALVNYSDNFGLVCRAEEVQLLEQTLREAFRTHAAGPFEITYSARSIREECRYLGYSFRVKHSRCRFWIRNADWRHRFMYMSGRLHDCSEDEIVAVLGKMDGYCRAWPAWAGAKHLRRLWQRQARQILLNRELEVLAPRFV